MVTEATCSWCGAPAETAIAANPKKLHLPHATTPACAACAARVLTPAITPPEALPAHADQVTIGDLLPESHERRDWTRKSGRR
jgi:hypothetical protein